MRAVIFAAGRERDAAAACREHLAGLCIPAVVAVDDEAVRPGEVWTGNRGALMGAAKAILLGRLLWEHSRAGDVVARIDADTRITAAGAEWLRGASETAASGYTTNHSGWCGCFAVRREHLERSLALLSTARGNACAGCTVTHCLEQHGTIERAPEGCVQRWAGVAQAAGGAHLVTLPSRLAVDERMAALRALWGI